MALIFSLSSFSEGEQAEAWLKEAGLEGLYDSSLESNSDQVSLV